MLKMKGVAILFVVAALVFGNVATEARTSRRLQRAPSNPPPSRVQSQVAANDQAKPQSLATEECIIRRQPEVVGTWLATDKDNQLKQVMVQFYSFNHCTGVGNVHVASNTGFTSSFDGVYVQVRPGYFRARTMAFVYDTQPPYKIVGRQVNEFDLQLTGADSGTTSYPGRATYLGMDGEVLGGFEFSLTFDRFTRPSLFEPYLPLPREDAETPGTRR